MAEMLLERETFNHRVWECAAGFGHISDVLKAGGYEVRQTDIISRREDISVLDFLALDNVEEWDGDIITNPPYLYAREFIEKGMSLLKEGAKMAMLLKLTFLEGRDRIHLFRAYPPSRIYVSVRRIACGKAGVFAKESAVCYSWFIWEKGFRGDPIIKWFNL